MQNYGIPFTGGTESKKPILASVKTEVYRRAKGCCESCGDKLKKSQGDFHHWRSSEVSPSAKTVQFLCPTCHRKYGHAIQTIAHHGILRKWKETIVVRLRVRKHPKKRIKNISKKIQIKEKPRERNSPKKRKTKTSDTPYIFSDSKPPKI